MSKFGVEAFTESLAKEMNKAHGFSYDREALLKILDEELARSE